LKYYEEAADITINTDNKSIDDIAEEIIEKLGY
jgi:shikimate kinase